MGSASIQIVITPGKPKWFVTKAPVRLAFEAIMQLPSDGGSQSCLEFTDIDLAVSIFGAWCASAGDAGFIQIFDAVGQHEIGYLHFQPGE